MTQAQQERHPVFIYSDDFQRFDYGPTHPMRLSRLALTRRLLSMVGFDPPSPPIIPAGDEELTVFHDRRYLDTLKEYSNKKIPQGFRIFGLGAGDNPAFPGLFDLAALCCGGSLLASRLVVEEKHPLTFNLAGGMHHAMAARASGFCYVNDAAVAIKHLVTKGLRVVYLDIDAHHGDGVQWAFYDTDQVLTISLHQHGATLFPGTGSLEETGREKGKGYAVNLPFWPDTDDDIYMSAFDQVVPPLIEGFAPDYIVTQLGVDTFFTDPLANLNLTTKAFGHCVRTIKELAQGRWIALGGGGYDLVNVARAWTLAWAIMEDKEGMVPEELPRELVEELGLREDESHLLDPEMKIRGRFFDRAKRDAAEAVSTIKRELFPRLGARG